MGLSVNLGRNHPGALCGNRFAIMKTRHRTGQDALPTNYPKPGSLLLLLLGIAVAVPGLAAGLQLRLSGVEGPAADNVRNFVNEAWFTESSLASARRREVFIAGAEERAVQALRPFGHYAAQSSGTLQRLENGDWELALSIDPGPAMLVEQASIAVQGEGQEIPALRQWLAQWPLTDGRVLDQTVWEAQKRTALERAGSEGYLLARFSAQRIELDLERNRARLVLELDTGPRAEMGTIEFRQSLVHREVLAAMSRFQAGDPYRAFLVEQFRLDLWRTGYFAEVEVRERRQLEEQPPRVDFLVTVEERKRDTHQGTVGVGTDTEFRMQYRWDRHLLSPRGDSFNTGLGWTQRDEQVRLFGEYRLPRKKPTPQYWAVSSLLVKETETLRITDDQGDFISLARGRVDNGSVRFSRVRLRPVENSRERVAESLFLEHLRETNDLTERELEGGEPNGDIRDVNDLLQQTSRSLSIGMDWDWPVISGRGFATTGHHERAWIFSANEAWGSELDFSQLYLSSRWNLLFGDRFKLLLRAEAGYSDADLVDLTVELEGEQRQFSVTRLPHRYRFRAGGSRSVRGYGFEELSSNGIGSNHLLTGSVELEYRFLEDWSAAAFFDAGNAFNEWDDRDIRHGAGLGLRWYTVAGAVRLDAGQALDKPGRPWEVYLTIGTPLL